MRSATSATNPYDRAQTRVRPHILLVEDDDDTRELMALALGGAGFDVRSARSGREALAFLADAPYDLVVTDYDMPEMTGTEMLAIAVQRGIVGGARPLIVTAHPSPKGIEGFPVVRKPLDLARFVALLRSFHSVGRPALDPTGVPTPPAAHRVDASRPGEPDSN